jgi:hypothetical protein
MPQPGKIEAPDTCARCGLQRATRALEARGITVRLCDDCYWGNENIQQGPGDHAKPARWRPTPEMLGHNL